MTRILNHLFFYSSKIMLKYFYEVTHMDKYKTIVVVKYTRRGMARAINRTMSKMIYRGFEFVQMTGNPLEAVALMFKVSGQEKPELSRKEMKALIKADKEKARLLKEQFKAEEEANKKIRKEDKEKAKLLKKEKAEELKQLKAQKAEDRMKAEQIKVEKKQEEALEKEKKAKEKFAKKEAEKAQKLKKIQQEDSETK